MKRHEFITEPYCLPVCCYTENGNKCGLPASADIHMPDAKAQRWPVRVERPPKGLSEWWCSDGKTFLDYASAEERQRELTAQPRAQFSILQLAEIRGAVLEAIDDGWKCSNNCDVHHKWRFNSKDNDQDINDEAFDNAQRLRFADAVQNLLTKESEPRMKSIELTTTEAVKAAREWQENSEMMIAPEIITALIEGCESLLETARSAALRLDGMANTLDRWSEGSKSGGWSTHLCTPMEGQANELRRDAARILSAIKSHVASSNEAK